jgi:hypothetical protein
MGWLLLLTVIAVIAYFFYSKKEGTLSLSKKEIRTVQDLLDQERQHAGGKKQAMVDQAAREGKTIPLSQVIGPLEKSKEVYRDDAQYVAAVNRTIDELKRRYDTVIPIDEAYPFVEKDEED